MWEITNLTPFAAESSWAMDERGAEFWQVAIRGSFLIDAQDRQHVPSAQTPLCRAPVFSGDPQKTGMVADSDFALWKAGTDVLVEGNAIALDRRPTRNSLAQFKVGSVQKSLKVNGDRVLSEGSAGLAISEARPFEEMPLTWERTYGGWDQRGEKQFWEPRNPAGCGFANDPRNLYGQPAPNIEYPDAPYRGPKSGTPAAFGPIAQHWAPRVGFAGTYDKAWEETRDPLLPNDFDRRYFRSAPADQQTATPLVGYEDVAVNGMTPEGTIRFKLPRVVLDIRTVFKRLPDVRGEASIHTLVIKPNQRRFEIVWLSALEVPPGRDEKLLETVVKIRPRIGVPASIRNSGVWGAD